MTTRTAHYYGVWIGGGDRSPQTRHRPTFIVRSETPKLVAAAALFENDGSSESRDLLVDHISIVSDPKGIRAMVEYGLTADGWNMPQPIGSGGQITETLVVLIPAKDLDSYKGSWPMLDVCDQLIEAVDWSDIISGRKVLDRIAAPSRPPTPGYQAAETYRQALVEQSRVALRTAEDQHMRMPNEFVIFDFRDRHHVVEAIHANDTDDVTMTRIRGVFSQSGKQLS